MKYGQKVRVTSGFYEGMEGTIKKVIEGDCFVCVHKAFATRYIEFLKDNLEIIL